jgi:hypothetical protein
MKKNGRLGHLGLPKVLFCAFEHDVGDIEAKDGICFIEQLLGEG